MQDHGVAAATLEGKIHPSLPRRYFPSLTQYRALKYTAKFTTPLARLSSYFPFSLCRFPFVIWSLPDKLLNQYDK